MEMAADHNLQASEWYAFWNQSYLLPSMWFPSATQRRERERRESFFPPFPVE